MTQKSTEISKEQVLSALSQVEDPELGIDVVSLGFIYEVEVKDDIVKVQYSLTTPGCPMANFIGQRIKAALGELVKEAGKEVELELVFEPMWNPDMMSDKAKQQLGYEE
jgi:metal-sulfur cluster biosynthetic enzyme